MTTRSRIAAWRVAATALALVPLLLIAACGSFSGSVRDSFSKTYTCPAERIAVTPRSDVAAHTVIELPEPPPAEVASDPARLALWKERRAKKRAEDDERQVFDVRGCGHDERYACERDSDESGSSITCQDGSLVRTMAETAAALRKLDDEKRRLDAELDGREAGRSRLTGLSTQMDDLAAELEKHPPQHLGITLGDGNGKGVVVRGVAPGASNDGKLAPGDLITAVDGLPVSNAIDFLRALSRHAPASPLELTIQRGAETRSVTLGAP